MPPAADESAKRCCSAHDRRRQLLDDHGDCRRIARDRRRARERLGTLIGPYKLLEQIGEGGMGVVFVAEQTEPVRRRVALKIIKPGMDTQAGDRPV